MITLSKKIKEEREKREKGLSPEAQEMVEYLPETCKVDFKNPNRLHDFHLTVVPDEGFWKDGIFIFHIVVPEEYNIKPPNVNCKTKIWHPNISESGEVCLSLLRQHTLDGSGWAPTRKLKDVVWGLNSLFTDLLNFDDPLNVEASQQFEENK
ncbi:hypothetical protein QZH41_013532, partial [Actinostola sp. cb2023]